MIIDMFGIKDEEKYLKDLTLNTVFGLEYLKLIVKKYPNDQDLGKHIRDIIINYKNNTNNE